MDKNLFLQSKEAFGYRFPNYNIEHWRAKLVNRKDGSSPRRGFNTGIHDATANPFWNAFWVNKTTQMGQTGVKVVTRKLRYRNKTVRLPDGTEYTFPTAEEKGIDVRIALDVIAGARNRLYDVAIVFSQDQDLAEVASEIRSIAKEQGRWIKIVCAFPDSPTAHNRRGINNTDWIRIDRAMYDRCIDPRDYRP